MACFVPFNNRNLDITLFVFKPTVVLVDELVESLKEFSICTENLGCIESSIFKSIHGNLIIWYRRRKKKSTENKELLIKTLISWISPATVPSMLTSMSSMAVLTERSFFDSYAGESKDGSNAAKFSNADIISMNLISSSSSSELHNVTYANLSLFKSSFSKMEGAHQVFA